MRFGVQPALPQLVLLLALASGCTSLGSAVLHPAATPGFAPLSEAACTEILSDSGDAETLRRAAENSLAYLQALSGSQTFTVGGATVTTAQLRRSVEIILEELDEQEGVRIRNLCRRLRLYQVKPHTDIVTTGYYTPVVAASRLRTDRFVHPIYRRPTDLVTAEANVVCADCDETPPTGRFVGGELVPYYSRQDIEGGAIADSAEVVAWLDDPIEVFFLHVQGSGVLELADGTRVPIGYAGSNGRAYRSIGKKLVDDGKMAREQATMETLKDYLRAHPDDRPAILNFNPRYIFFDVDHSGPRGSLGFPVTPGRSLAADPRVYPPAALVFVQLLAHPSPAGARLAFIQDRGAAIVGPGRLDLYLGSGPDAGAVAGALRATTALYLPLPVA